MRKPRPLEHPDSEQAAYTLVLRWLAMREVSQGQARERLERRGYSNDAVDRAIHRLVREGVLDDRRAAAAVAETQARIRRHGPARIMGRLLAMRIDRQLAEDVVRDVFRDAADALLEQALEKRLKGDAGRLKDPAERRRLLGYLVRQGFSPSAASTLIRARARQK